MKCNQDKFKGLDLERKNQMPKYKMRNNWLGSCTPQKDLGLVVFPKLNMKQSCDVAKNGQISFWNLFVGLSCIRHWS